MQILTSFSPKGMTGDPTSCIEMALMYISRNATITILANGPKSWLDTWTELNPIPAGLNIRRVAQEDIANEIRKAAKDSDYLLICTSENLSPYTDAIGDLNRPLFYGG